MKRSTIIKKLAELVDLQDQARKYMTGDMSEWVPAGLFTEAEMQEYHEVDRIIHTAYAAGRQAEDDFPKPDFVTNPEYPAEYLEIVKRINELEPMNLVKNYLKSDKI